MFSDHLSEEQKSRDVPRADLLALFDLLEDEFLVMMRMDDTAGDDSDAVLVGTPLDALINAYNSEFPGSAPDLRPIHDYRDLTTHFWHCFAHQPWWRCGDLMAFILANPAFDARVTNTGRQLILRVVEPIFGQPFQEYMKKSRPA